MSPYTPPPIMATGDTISAAFFNQYIRDNFESSVPAIFTDSGQFPITSGTNSVQFISAPKGARRFLATTSGTSIVSWLRFRAAIYAEQSGSFSSSGGTLVKITSWNIPQDWFSMYQGSGNFQILQNSGYLIVFTGHFAGVGATGIVLDVMARISEDEFYILRKYSIGSEATWMNLLAFIRRTAGNASFSIFIRSYAPSSTSFHAGRLFVAKVFAAN